MFNRISPTQLLRYAGLFTWAMVGIPLQLAASSIPAQEGAERVAAETNLHWWLLAYSTFGAGYWLVTRSLGVRRPRWYDVLLLGVLTACAIAVCHFSGSGLGGILLLVLAGVLPWLLPLSVGIPWLLLQHLALIPIFMLQGFKTGEAILQSMLFVGYSSFTFITALVARHQAQAREEQRRLNNELRATRALLAESTRLSERMRISRELHDLLGHHLTALSLNLEVANHLTAGKAQEHVRQAHTLAKLLLTDVREAVSQLRDEGAVDMGTALRTLTEGVLAPAIHLQMPDPFLVEDPEHANVLLRCAQEIITNTLRHAQADNLWLSFRRDGAAVQVQARDDGRGAAAPTAGNGLRGMRERLAQHGGSVRIDSAHGVGFALELTLPMDKPA
ncbi:MAG: sensor histidine kinase [Proteobacteria bacterium]|nr:sensor histidine kinase [Pseudomonadota bacterium]MBS0463419.1 sensor histidine kinase [Pseudomonadota bacterium]